MFCRK